MAYARCLDEHREEGQNQPERHIQQLLSIQVDAVELEGCVPQCYIGPVQLK
jgi:hypothetical protein